MFWSVCSSGSTEHQRPRSYAGNRRAYVRNAQSLDGRDPLPHQVSPRVSTEMSLHVLAYNLKRMMQIFGATSLMKAITA